MMALKDDLVAWVLTYGMRRVIRNDVGWIKDPNFNAEERLWHYGYLNITPNLEQDSVILQVTKTGLNLLKEDE